MELLTVVAVAVAMASAVVFLLYKMWTKDEDTFAKAMANKQITLLDDTTTGKKAEKKDNKQQHKKKEEKKKKSAAPAEAREETAAVAVVPEPAIVSLAAAQHKESPKEAKPASKTTTPVKVEEPKKKETPVKEKVTVEEEVKKISPSQTASAPAEESKKPQTNGNGGAKKAAKKPKQVEEIDNEEEFVEAKTKKAKKSERKEAAPATAVDTAVPRHLSLKDLDTNKVIARLSSIDEVELEYIEYLNNYFQETATNAARAASLSAQAQRQIDESGRALMLMKNERAKMESELESTRRTMAQLATKAANSSSAEMELRSQINNLGQESEKLRGELEAAKRAAAAAAVVVPPAPIVIDNKEEVEKLKTEAKAAANRVYDLEDQLKNAKENAAKERKQLEQTVLQHKSREDAAVGQEVLLAESRQNAKAISQRLTELEQVKETLEGRVVEAEKRAEELKNIAHQREASHAADTLSLKTMIEELNKEVVRFEEAKKEQAELAVKLDAKDAELEAVKTALAAANKQKDDIKKNSDESAVSATSQIATLTKRVAELEKAVEDARMEVRVLPAIVPAVEEVVELKKAASLESAPSSAATNEEVTALKQQVERLQAKNSELRTRNHAIVDQLTEIEKRVLNGSGAAAAPSTSAAPAADEKTGKKKGGKKGGEEKSKSEEEQVRAERRLVQAVIAKQLGEVATLDEGTDQKGYEKWLQSVSASLKQDKEKAKKDAAAAAAAKAKPAATTAAPAGNDEVEQLKAENESFRDALATLELELQTIEQLKSEREETYARRIAELESSHGKTQIAEVRSAIGALSVRSTAVSVASTPSPPRASAAVAAAASPPTSQSEDDSSWEVVA